MTQSGSGGSLEPNSSGESLAGGHDDGFVRAFVGDTPAGLFAVDGSSTLVFVNPAMADLFGYTPVELVGEPLSTIVPDRYARVHAIVDLVFRADDADVDAWSIEVPAVDADGRDVWTSCSLRGLEYGGERFVAGSIRDVSERRDREDDLVRYERIIETVDDGIYVLDASFTITDVNEAVVSMTGYSREELIGSHVSMLTTEETIRRAAELSVELTERQRDAETLVADIVTKDGEAIPIETRFSLYPFDDDSFGQVGVVRDITDRKQFEDTLTALHGSTRELLTVESRAAVCERIVDTATDVVDLAAAVVYLFDREANVLRPTGSRDSVTGSPDELPTLSHGEGVPWQVFVEGETVVLDGSTEDDGDPRLPAGNVMYVPLGDHGVFLAVSRESGTFDDDTRTLVELLAASAEAGLASLEREFGIRARDHELERQNRRLRRLDEVNGIIREIDQALVEAESAAEIREAVTERLVSADRFAFAWIGEPDPETGTLRPRAWAGTEDGYLDDVAFSVDDPAEPATRAAVDRELQVVSDVGSDLRGERWRKAAIARDFRSLVSVPLVHDDILFGVLCVYAARPGAFDDMATTLGELGETIANAMDAVATKRAMLVDTRVELGFRLSAPDDVIQRIAGRTGSAIDLAGIVPGSGGTSRVFATVDDAEPAVLLDLQERFVAVDSVQLIAERDDSHLVEVVTDGTLVAATFVEMGAVVRTLSADGDGIRLHVDVPNDVDVREFVEGIRSRYSDAELVYRRDFERPLRTPTEFRFDFEERLTERQMEILRVAYLSGFFEWPRETNGQQIADLLDVSQPTVNRHLRTCERKLFGLLFDDR